MGIQYIYVLSPILFFLVLPADCHRNSNNAIVYESQRDPPEQTKYSSQEQQQQQQQRQ